MAEFLTETETRNYKLADGTTRDLIALIDTGRPEGWTKGHEIGMFAVGQVVYVDALGGWRRGVVTKVAKTKVSVALTTDGAIKDSQPHQGRNGLNYPGSGVIRVQNAAYPAGDILADADRDESQDEDQELIDSIEETEPEATETEDEIPAGAAATGSTVVIALEKVWDRIRQDVPELPEVVMITGTGTKGIGPSRWGHFLRDGWEERSQEGTKTYRHEMFIAGEALAKGARQVVQTMLHEAAHVLAAVRKVQDTSRQGRWHNGTFRKLAEEMGLEHKNEKAHTQHGYSFVTMTPGTAEDYADVIKELDEAIRITVGLPFWLGGPAAGGSEDDEDGSNVHGLKPPKAEGGKSSSNNVKCVCECEDPNIIRMSRKVLERASIRCEDCDALFAEDDA